MPFQCQLRKAISQRHNSIFYAKIYDRGIRRGNTGQILTRWRRPVASRSRVALDLPYLAMCLTLYHLIRMAIEMTSKVGAIFSTIDFMSCINCSETAMLRSNKNKAELQYCLLLYLQLVCILWWLDEGHACHFGYHCRRRASNCCNLHIGRRNKLFSPLFY